jgi:phosphoribosylanthranilate isomerase
VRVTVKICGLTGPADAREAAAAGADYLGFVFFPASKRRLDVGACAWIRELGPAPPKVGVFRDQEGAFVEGIREAADLQLVQLHGGEPPSACAALGGRERVIKAVPVGDVVSWRRVMEYAPVARILFDTASPVGGGTGRTFDWAVLGERPAELAYWLAGGLTPENVGAAIARLHPAGVDVASGVEAAVGRKDPARMRAFVAAARWSARGGGGDRA